MCPGRRGGAPEHEHAGAAGAQRDRAYGQGRAPHHITRIQGLRARQGGQESGERSGNLLFGGQLVT